MMKILNLISFIFLCKITGHRTVGSPSNPTDGVCQGTNSGMSLSSNRYEHYRRLYRTFSNCTTVIGNLEITGLDSESATNGLSFLKTIEVVTGYVLISYNYVPVIPLDNLRIIRGMELYSSNGGEYALFVFSNINYQNITEHLRSIRFRSLSEIVRGSVFIDKNKLCFIQTINWNDIFHNFGGNYSTVSIQRNYPTLCGACDSSCYNGSCWEVGPLMCQNYSKLTCNQVCGGARCRGPGRGDCCSTECAVGCTGPTDRDCLECLHVNNDGRCQESCPPLNKYDPQTQRFIRNPESKFHYWDLCVDRCPNNLLIQDNGCVKSCQVGYFDNGTGECIKCSGNACEKECFGVSHDDGPLSNNDTVDSLNIHHFEGCNIVKGNLVFLPHVFSRDEPLNIPPIVESQLMYLRNIRKITGYLKIGGWIKNLTNFSVFENLEEIDGIELYRNVAALAIFNLASETFLDQITSLGFRSLKKIKNGNVYIRYLNNLCYGRLVNWSIVLQRPIKFSRFTNGFWIDSNGANCSGIHCHPLCDGNGCWGPGPNQCLRCNETSFSYNGTCYSECSEEMAVYALPGEQECQTCDPECVTCVGPGPTNCTACRHYSNNGACVASCPLNKYNNSNNECTPCNDTCFSVENKQVCTGPQNKPGVNGCNLCEYVIATQTLQPVRCLPLNSTCPDSHFKIDSFAGSQYACVPCYKGCHNCSGVGIEDCFHEIGLSGESLAIAVCLPVMIIFILSAVFALSFIRRRNKKKKWHQRLSMKALGLVDMGAEQNTDPTERLVEPVTPSGVAPNQAQLRIVKDSELKITKLLGSGAFGTVHKGYWTPDVDMKERVKVPVAIKVLRDGSSQVASNELLDEAFLMASCEHPNLVRLLGICLSQKILLVTQLMPLGDLLNYVRMNKDNITSQHLLNWSLQISKGMYYLSEEKHLVHRDLAARNVLVKSPHHVRITDFGLAKLLDGKEDVYRAEGGKMPIKWLALESIQHRIFTQKSDVWSFGVTMWELLTFGKKPYENIQAKDIFPLLERGERLSQPSICTIDIYLLLIKCWTVYPESRPSFRELSEELSRMARDPSRYIVIVNEDNRCELPSPSYSEILNQLKSEMNDEADECQIADADEYFPHKSSTPVVSGFSLQPAPTTVPWKRLSQVTYANSTAHCFSLKDRENVLIHSNMNVGPFTQTSSIDQDHDPALTSINSSVPGRFPSSISSFSSSTRANCDDHMFGIIREERFFPRHQSSEDSPITATFNDAFDVFGPPTPKRIQEMIAADEGATSDSPPLSNRACEDSTTMRYNSDTVSMHRQETMPNVYLDPNEIPFSPFLFQSQSIFSNFSPSALANPEYASPIKFARNLNNNLDFGGYEIPISSVECEAEYENFLVTSKFDGSMQRRKRISASQGSSKSEKINSDSGLPSDEEIEKRKTSVINPNYEWLESSEAILDNCLPEYQNLVSNKEDARLNNEEDDIFNDSSTDNAVATIMRTYSEPDSGVGIEIGVKSSAYKRAATLKNS